MTFTKNQTKTGYFPTVVYMKVPKKIAVKSLIPIQKAYKQKIEKNFNVSVDTNYSNSDLGFHVSLSQTWYLREHQLEKFSRSLATSLHPFFVEALSTLLTTSPIVFFKQNIQEDYEIEKGVKVFGVLKFNSSTENKIKSLIDTVDNVGKNYGQPSFYSPPQPHISLIRLICLSTLPLISLSNDTFTSNAIPVHFPCAYLRIGKSIIPLCPRYPIHFISQQIFLKSETIDYENSLSESTEEDLDCICIF